MNKRVNQEFVTLLARYYQRQKGSIHFQNGMSLNQLAFAMWERLEYSQIDPSTLSRVLSGQRLFTKRQLEVFGDVLGVSQVEQAQLYEALLVDLLQRHQFDTGESRSSLLTQFLRSVQLHIYFTGALVQQTAYGQYYQQIVDQLRQLGHLVTEDSSSTPFTEVQAKTKAERIAYYNYIDGLINEVDVVVAEVSFPSTLNIGHEVTLALQRGKPVVACYYQGKESYFFEGNANDHLIQTAYTADSLDRVLAQSIAYAQLLALTTPGLREKMGGKDRVEREKQ